MPGKFAPTLTHHFIAMLEERGSSGMPGLMTGGVTID